MHLLLAICLLGVGVASGINPISSQPENETKSIDDIIHINQALLSEDNPQQQEFLEGDILMTSTTYSPKMRRWPKKGNFVPIPYRLSSKYEKDSIVVILEAFSIIEANSCVRFVPYKNEQDYIFIKPMQGCYSSVGFKGRDQLVSLGNECITKGKGVVLHEMMHVLGFWHEHSRSDRDHYVKINFEAVIPSFRMNFCKYDTTNMITPYSYTSIMHYSKSAFAEAGKESIVPLASEVKIGQRLNLNKDDIKRINLLYLCPPYVPVNGETDFIDNNSPPVIYDCDSDDTGEHADISALLNATSSPSTIHDPKDKAVTRISDLHESKATIFTTTEKSGHIAPTSSSHILKAEHSATTSSDVHGSLHKTNTSSFAIFEHDQKAATNTHKYNAAMSLLTTVEPKLPMSHFTTVHHETTQYSVDYETGNTTAVNVAVAPVLIQELANKAVSGHSTSHDFVHNAATGPSAVYEPEKKAAIGHFNSPKPLQEFSTSSAELEKNSATSPSAMQARNGAGSSSDIYHPQSSAVTGPSTVTEPIKAANSSLVLSKPVYSAATSHFNGNKPSYDVTNSSSSILNHLQNTATRTSAMQESTHNRLTRTSAFYELSPATNAYSTQEFKSSQRKVEPLKNVVKRALADLKGVLVKKKQQLYKSVLKSLFNLPDFGRPHVPIMEHDSFCGFEHWMCGWKQSTDDDLDWSLSWGNVNLYNGHFKAKGFHLSLRSSKIESVTRKKGLLSRLITQPSNCITFWYSSLHGIMGTLKIYILLDTGEQTLLWSAERQEHVRWTRAQIVWPLYRGAQVVVEGVVDPKVGSKIGIDNLYVGNCF